MGTGPQQVVDNPRKELKIRSIFAISTKSRWILVQ